MRLIYLSEENSALKVCECDIPCHFHGYITRAIEENVKQSYFQPLLIIYHLPHLTCHDPSSFVLLLLIQLRSPGIPYSFGPIP